ncbi:hypothetical protein NL676_033426 [Syzygium grande]|nr:hypothetical protein NL676_033426 [Syzygium grande]
MALPGLHGGGQEGPGQGLRGRARQPRQIWLSHLACGCFSLFTDVVVFFFSFFIQTPSLPHPSPAPQNPSVFHHRQPSSPSPVISGRRTDGGDRSKPSNGLLGGEGEQRAMTDANAIEVAGGVFDPLELFSFGLFDSISGTETFSAFVTALTDEPDALGPQACLDSGFFYVINHGISQDLMEDVFVQSRRFFSLPLSEKMKLLRNEKNRGYTPMFDEILEAENQIQGDYKEGYYIGVEVPEDDPDVQKPYSGPNLWPSEVNRLLNMISGQLRVIAGLISDPSKGIYGAGAHSDFGFITLLATDDVPGLQLVPYPCELSLPPAGVTKLLQLVRHAPAHLAGEVSPVELSGRAHFVPPASATEPPPSPVRRLLKADCGPQLCVEPGLRGGCALVHLQGEVVHSSEAMALRMITQRSHGGSRITNDTAGIDDGGMAHGVTWRDQTSRLTAGRVGEQNSGGDDCTSGNSGSDQHVVVAAVGVSAGVVTMATDVGEEQWWDGGVVEQQQVVVAVQEGCGQDAINQQVASTQAKYSRSATAKAKGARTVAPPLQSGQAAATSVAAGF